MAGITQLSASRRGPWRAQGRAVLLLMLQIQPPIPKSKHLLCTALPQIPTCPSSRVGSCPPPAQKAPLPALFHTSHLGRSRDVSFVFSALPEECGRGLAALHPPFCICSLPSVTWVSLGAAPRCFQGKDVSPLPNWPISWQGPGGASRSVLRGCSFSCAPQPLQTQSPGSGKRRGSLQPQRLGGCPP